MDRILTIGNIRKRVAPMLKSRGIIRAGLFGSAARGELRRGSDVDMLIETDGTLGLFELVGLKQDLEMCLKRRVDLIEYDAIKPAFRKSILRDHVAVV